MLRVVLIGMMLLGGAAAFAEEKFLIACNQNTVGTSAYHGIVALLGKAFSQLGYTIEVVPYPAERSLLEANEGHADGELARPKAGMEPYKNLILVPEPVDVITTHAYTVKAPVSKVTWDFLRDYRVLSLIGAKPSEVNLKDKMRTGEFLQVATLDSAFAMLLSDRVDYVVMLDAYEAKYWTDRVKVKRTEPVIEQAVYYFVLNSKHQKLVDRLAQALKDVKAGK